MSNDDDPGHVVPVLVGLDQVLLDPKILGSPRGVIVDVGLSADADKVDETIVVRVVKVSLGSGTKGHVETAEVRSKVVILFMVTDGSHVGGDRSEGLDLVAPQIPDLLELPRGARSCVRNVSGVHEEIETSLGLLGSISDHLISDQEAQRHHCAHVAKEGDGERTTRRSGSSDGWGVEGELGAPGLSGGLRADAVSVATLGRELLELSAVDPACPSKDPSFVSESDGSEVLDVGRLSAGPEFGDGSVIDVLCDPRDGHGRGGVAERKVDLLGGTVIVETSKAQTVLGPVDEPVKVHVDLLDDDVL
mmetsp:Transcript_46314/g.77159  ORF Transcript_46314/g.77159 Transcript_46314/m.77159 type:complete len:305 (-) Transcript_46314:147-1061(-)